MTKKNERAFTLVEMLIVIGIIVILVSIGVPMFRALSGGRSTEAAANNLNAILGRARTEAIGKQKPVGVLFLLDPASNRVNCVIVTEDGPPNMPPATGYEPLPGAAYLNVTDTAESILLPVGVGMQMLDDDRSPGSLAPDDSYLGFNEVHYRVATNPSFGPVLNYYSEENGAHVDTGSAAKCAGVILFDSQGRIMVRPYRLKLSTGSAPTALHKLLRYDPDGPYAANQAEARPGNGTTPAAEARSSIGLVLFDRDKFLGMQAPGSSRNFGDDDPQVFGLATTADEFKEENWLRDNAVHYYVNRTNGALIKAE